MSTIKDWSTTAASNNASPPDGFPEGMAPGSLNDSSREAMAGTRSYYEAPEWREWGHTITYASATTFTTAAGDGDTTSIYHANRRVRAIGTATTTIYGSISGSVHTSQTTVTVVWDSGSLVNEALVAAVGAVADTDHIPYAALADIPAAATPIIESGTEMLFFQAAAPTGWTQTTAQNDKSLRVVSGTGGGVGGTHGLSSPPTTAHMHTGPSHDHSIGSHNHQWYVSKSGFDEGFASNGTTQTDFTGSIESEGILYGTSASLDASWYTNNSSGTSGLGGTGNTSNTGPTAFAPLYIDVITATKDP